MAAIGADRDQCRVYTWHEVVPWQDALEHSRGWQRDPEAFYPMRNTLLPTSACSKGCRITCLHRLLFTDKGSWMPRSTVSLPGSRRTRSAAVSGRPLQRAITAPDDLSGGAPIQASAQPPVSPSSYGATLPLPRAYLAPPPRRRRFPGFSSASPSRTTTPADGAPRCARGRRDRLGPRSGRPGALGLSEPERIVLR